MNPLLKTLGGLAAVGVAGVGYAGLVERNAYTLRRFSVPVLPDGAAPLRVLCLSDLHLMPNQRRKVEWVRGLAALDPDLVVNTGDNIAHPDSVPRLLEAMEPLLEVPGAFVLGSNDYFAPTFKNPALYLTPWHRRGTGSTPRLPTSDLVKGLVAGGWEDLTNRRARVTVGGQNLELVGVDDAHLDYDRYAVVAGPADASAVLTIGVTHAPYQRVLDAMTADGAGLVLAGHTHGGQLAVPFHGALVTNCDLDTGRVKGVSRWWPGAGHTPSSFAPDDAAWLHVSAGLGTSPYAPVRFACRPEATLLTLTSR
ncbi:metallophosphoesterase [Phycicoccus sp. SLBN-51]|uniref:metallophosphoesterase n=1 Tax=Phycicoccus sp. SLBN-51 TaxID=2768447 RepID=UPI00114E321D|nr:metallophosphoesterase [Phycicoccus sp. SLBN-51]TQJ49229.1 putative MPP superfamily phosphohydrolase [Phycicoccus sp. SLBN-51]